MASPTTMPTATTEKPAVEKPAADSNTNVDSEANDQNGKQVVEDYKVFVGNLPFKATQEMLTEFFGGAGKVVDATIIKHGRRSLGYGFVAFGTAAEAEKARNELNKKSFDGREINVEVAKPKTSEEAKAERRAAKQQKRKEKQAAAAAATATAAADPAVEAAANDSKADDAMGSDDTKRTRKSERRRRSTKSRRSKKATTAATSEGETQAQGETPQEESGKTVTTSSSESGEGKKKKAKAPRRKQRRSEENAEPSKTLVFVANLPYSTTDEGLGEVFKSYKVKSAQVAKMRSGRSKGYGFVDLENQEEQQRALENIKDVELDGRVIYLKAALSERAASPEANGTTSAAGSTEEKTVKREPKQEEPKKEEIKKAEPKKEEPKKEEPEKEEPKKEEHKKEEPKKEEPKKEELKKEDVTKKDEAQKK
ncbi:hypothetical protein BCR43DRAFT_482336 [Syncephalastrum racemosum]|uniref:RRM domain-containing protein n=1 Tax=Syncephalastrum racemosum TaxID=13706 RepID=A0A1X2HTJ9_SYNRA|nr:hypothetical protein BCR43DRAFT_482336 [Syncephalastrum racemosum]